MGHLHLNSYSGNCRSLVFPFSNYSLLKPQNCCMFMYLALKILDLEDTYTHMKTATWHNQFLFQYLPFSPTRSHLDLVKYLTFGDANILIIFIFLTPNFKSTLIANRQTQSRGKLRPNSDIISVHCLGKIRYVNTPNIAYFQQVRKSAVHRIRL